MIAGEGLGVAAEVLLHVAEGVPCCGLVEAVAELVVQVKGLAAAGEGFAVIPELNVSIGDAVERVRLTVAVPVGLVQVQRLLPVP